MPCKGEASLEDRVSRAGRESRAGGTCSAETWAGTEPGARAPQLLVPVQPQQAPEVRCVCTFCNLGVAGQAGVHWDLAKKG